MNEQNPENGQDGKPPSSLSVRLSSVITFIFLSTAAIVIAYIWGVMVGRSGGVPEYAKNEIVRNETKRKLIRLQKFHTGYSGAAGSGLCPGFAQ